MSSRQQRATTPDLGANQEGSTRDTHLSAPILAREARKVMADKGWHLSGSRVRHLIRRYLNTGQAGGIDFRSWFLVYADPTGERAAANVDRLRGHHP